MSESSDPANIDVVCDQFEAAWTAGQRPQLEKYLGRIAEPERSALLTELLQIELWWRRDELASPEAADYKTRFPEFADAVDIAVQQFDERSVLSQPDESAPEATFIPSAGDHVRYFGEFDDRGIDIAQRALRDVSGEEKKSEENVEQENRDPAMDETLSFIVANEDGLINTVIDSPTKSAVEGNIEGGTILNDRYRLESRLGEGGMGTVMLGEDLRLGRRVALKLIRDRHWNSTHRDLMKSEFENEAKIGAGLVHPAIAAVHDYGFHEATPYIVFEHVGGESLTDRIRNNAPMDIDDVRDVIGRLAVALDYAHQRGIVHRDLKPDNIRFDEYGQPKILDFGLAKEFRSHSNWSFAGTPAYASPEQANEQPSDGRTDQYALGLIAFEMLTGQRPFSTGSWQEMLAAHREQQPIWPDDIAVPDSAKAVVLRALSKPVNERFHSCSEFAVHLGCQIELKKAASITFALEGPAKLPKQGVLPNHAYLGLVDGKLWISTNERIHVIDVGRLISATTVAPHWKPKGVLGKDIFGTTNTNRKSKSKTLWLYEKRSGPWWNRSKANLPAEVTPITLPTPEIAACWAGELQQIIDCSDNVTCDNDSELATEVPTPTLVKSSPDSRAQIIGPCAISSDIKQAASLKLKLYAARSDADAVVDFQLEKLVSASGTRWNARGIAIKSIDGTTRDEFQLREYAKRCRNFGLSTVAFTLVTLAIRLGTYRLPALRWPPLTVLNANVNTALILYSLPLLALAGLVVVTRWPQLVKPLAFFTATWSLLTFLVIMGILVARWNELPAVDHLPKIPRGIRRAISKMEGMIVTTGFALAYKLVSAGRMSHVTGSQKESELPARPKAAILWWIIAVVYVTIPVTAIGWGVEANAVAENPVAAKQVVKAGRQSRSSKQVVKAGRQSKGDEDRPAEIGDAVRLLDGG